MSQSNATVIEFFARAIVRHRFVVIASWMVISILALPWAARVDEVLSIDSEWVRPVESSQVDSFIEQVLPRAQAKIIAVVLSAPMAVDSVPFSSLVQGIAHVVGEQPYVRDVISYLDGDELNLVSSDRHTTALIATIGSEHADTVSRVIPAFRTTIRQMVDTHPLVNELEIAVTGEPALEWDVRTVSIVDARRGELRALAPTAAVLVLAFGALTAAAVPIVIGVLAITGALAALYVVGVFTPI
ncbi:MAG: MMPL family transporter, partial [Pseudomonadales bacterium]